MAQIYTRLGTSCADHPHRAAERRCTRCAQPFCAECLAPGQRAADGSRGWYCAPCARAVAEAAAAATRARTLRVRLGRLAAAARPVAAAVAALALLGALVAVSLRYLGPRPAHEGTCGELTRIRAVAGIGVPEPTEAVNFLAYPHRASVRVLAPSGTGGAGVGGGAAGAAGHAAALVDECPTGWRSAPAPPLPVDLLLEPRQQGAWLQRIGLWQDPQAPRSAWVQDFEVLVSPGEAGDDFQPLRLDRPARLQPTTEPQWFLVVRPPPAAGVAPRDLAPQERERYAQAFPDALPARRILIRVLSTYGDAQPGAGAGAVALGEVAAYGADLEVGVHDEIVLAGEDAGTRTGAFLFEPAEIRALAGRPTFVLFLNHSVEAHTLVIVDQDRNLELRAEPRQAVSGQFVANGRPGRSPFFCRLPGHDRRGLVGSVIVR